MTQLVPTIATDANAAAATALSAGDLAEVLAAFNDVTARLHTSHEALRGEVARLQAELRDANEQIERSRRLAALGEMAAGIAHEVRNPLGSIRLYARMLEQDLIDRPTEQGVARKIAAAVTGLDAIVGDVLTFAREMRVAPLASETEAMITRAIEECRDCSAGIDVVVRVEPPAASVVCDAALAHRALTNILRNAFEAVRDHAARDGQSAGAPIGRVTVTAGLRRARRGGPGEAVVSVRDSGPGVPEHVLPRIFNPFFTTRASGTGLGLAIVHRIMDAHAGRVSVSNERDADGRVLGARVELMFPQTNVHQSPRPTPARAGTELGQIGSASGSRRRRAGGQTAEETR